MHKKGSAIIIFCMLTGVMLLMLAPLVQSMAQAYAVCHERTRYAQRNIAIESLLAYAAVRAQHVHETNQSACTIPIASWPVGDNTEYQAEVSMRVGKEGTLLKVALIQEEEVVIVREHLIPSSAPQV